MKALNILVIGGGIGGLTSAIALQGGPCGDRDRARPHLVGVWRGHHPAVERASAAQQLGILEGYLAAGVGFDAVEIFLPNGHKVARIPGHPVAPGLPANMGIGRPALHKLLGDSAKAAGAQIRLGLTAEVIDDTGEAVNVTF
jgi:2-polyprenyl-6-methoxyphenol hydroxylase-like FAD-dependent oxidoreductase